MEEVTQDIAKIQTQRETEASRPALIDKRRPVSINNRLPASVDDNLPHSNPMKSQPDSYTRAEIDQFIEEIYRTLESTEERLDRRCDDIYFPMDLTMSSLTSQTEPIQREKVEIQRYIAPTNRGRLVPKVKSDVSDTYNHGEEISAGTYATLMRHQFNLESLGDRLQKIEDATATMKDKWRRGDEAMRDFTGTWFNKRREEMETCLPASSSFPHY
ncbi:hypothetical protein F2Q70_00030627 [Brassica cretica]|uniref:Uncharacterized protein n=1 Tax=Brassica cretica TaxID=69181 RepID=A0A8S9FL52_BRACR|nr:hypothetical protein F2Q70_00030627 [Brassica cretica]